MPASTREIWTQSATKSSRRILCGPYRAENPLSGTEHGTEEVLAFFAQLLRANIRVTLDPAADPATGIDTFGESTVVEVHRGQGQTTTRDASGNEVTATLNALNCTHYRIRDGRIAQVQVYISDQHTVDTFFWAVYQLKPIPDRLAQTV